MHWGIFVCLYLRVCDSVYLFSSFVLPQSAHNPYCTSATIEKSHFTETICTKEQKCTMRTKIVKLVRMVFFFTFCFDDNSNQSKRNPKNGAIQVWIDNNKKKRKNQFEKRIVRSTRIHYNAVCMCMKLEWNKRDWCGFKKQCNKMQTHIFDFIYVYNCKCNFVCQTKVESNDSEKISSLFDQNMRLDCSYYCFVFSVSSPSNEINCINIKSIAEMEYLLLLSFDLLIIFFVLCV